MENSNDILILFATHTGNAEDLADTTEEMLKRLGRHVDCLSVYDVDLFILQKYPICLLFASTWGEGEAPDDAEDFYHNLDGAKNLDLTQLRFAVYGLGDSDYDDFNQCGKDFDRMLAERGASRMVDRVDADIDYEEPYEKWISSVEAALKQVPQLL